MNTLNENWDLICSKLEQVKHNKNGIVALCPFHDDKNPSLTASYTDEKILVKCQAECTFEEIVSALGMEQSQFFAPKEKPTPKKIVAKYRYEDKDGGHVFNVIRYSDKTFSQQRADGRWSMDGVERTPYRLPLMLTAIKEGKEILIIEGEKDCDNAEKLGLVATTFAGGAGKWREEYSKWFQEAKVICLPDNDPPGRNGMHLIASKIEKVAESVRWLELPDVPEKGDLSDWLSIEGNDLNKIQELISNAKQWNKKINKDSLVVLTLEELLKKEIPPRKNLLTPWLPSQGLCMIYSKRGLGKTWLALEIAYAVSSGGRFLNWEAEYSQGVLYIDGEMPLSLMQERLSQIENSRGKKIGGLFKNFIS